MQEFWSKIVIEPKWEISNLGNIRRNNKNLKLRLRKDGYVDVKLGYKRYLLHRLLAMTFINNPNNLPQVNHIDGIRSNYNLSNLEWVDQFSNMKHAIATGLFPDRKGVKNGRAVITKETALKIKKLLKKGSTSSSIASQLGVTYTTVTNIKYGKSWVYLTLESV